MQLLKLKKYGKLIKKEAQCIFGTNDNHHPGVKNLFENTCSHYVSGKLKKADLPNTMIILQLDILQKSQNEFGKLVEKIVAFQTRNPMHRAHKEIAMLAAEENNANLLIHPVVGPTGVDVDHYTRVDVMKRF